MVGDLVTEGPFVGQPHTGRFEKQVECATLLLNGEGEVDDVKKLCGGRDVLVEVLKQQRFGMLRLISQTNRDGSTREKKRSRGCSPSVV